MTKKESLSITALLILSFFFAVLSPILFTESRAYAQEELLNMNESECVAFIKENGISIPAGFEKSGELGNFVKTTIDNVLTDPNYQFAYNFDETLKFAERIKSLVLKKYSFGCSASPTKTTANYQLQNNFVKNSSGNWVTSGGAWNALWENFNCYAYSINKWKNRGNDYPYQPGQFAGVAGFSYLMSVNILVNIIIKDLKSLNMTNIITSSTVPIIKENQELICVRVGADDYHFMKYDLFTNAWYHKPGMTAVLKYKYIPANNLIWNSEYSLNGIEKASNTSYDSDIVFIKYDNNIQSVSNFDVVKFNTDVTSGKDFIQELNVPTTNSYNFKISSNALMKVWIYDEAMTFIKEYSGTFINIDIAFNRGTHHIGFSFSSTASGNINTTVHVHSYNDHNCKYCNLYSENAHDYSHLHIWVNTRQHKSMCSCGDFVLKAHVISKSKFTTNASYSICIVCNGKAEFGQIIQDANTANAIYVTKNGSFILPNGIIVLADNDYEAYFNDTLKFTLNHSGIAERNLNSANRILKKILP